MPPDVMREKISADELAGLFRRAKLLSLDVDGTMTDGALYYFEDGSEVRVFDTHDGLGVELTAKSGLAVAIITASITPSIRIRGRKLGVPYVYTGCRDKLKALDEICGKIGATLADVIHIGDDLNDIPVLERVGMPIAVANAAPEVAARALYVTRRPGGHGAVRELCEAILKARGAWPY